jgi:hypothetical protein
VTKEKYHGGETPFIGARNITFHCAGRAFVLTFIMKVDQIEAFPDLNPALWSKTPTPLDNG